jgi:hypothetical protein
MVKVGKSLLEKSSNFPDYLLLHKIQRHKQNTSKKLTSPGGKRPFRKVSFIPD